MPNVLIADDEEFVRYYLRSLVKNLRWEVTAEADSANGLFELINEKKPDILLLDINMPDINGYDFLCQYGEKLKKDVCIVILTISASHNIQQSLADMGYGNFLRKDTNPYEIRDYLEKCWTEFLRKDE